MLKQIFSLYIESLLLTTALIGGLSGILILARMASRKDKTAKARQAHLFDVLLIDIMTLCCKKQPQSCRVGSWYSRRANE